MDETRHGFEDGDSVKFTEVKGMDEINEKVFKIKVCVKRLIFNFNPWPYSLFHYHFVKYVKSQSFQSLLLISNALVSVLQVAVFLCCAFLCPNLILKQFFALHELRPTFKIVGTQRKMLGRKIVFLLVPSSLITTHKKIYEIGARLPKLFNKSL